MLDLIELTTLTFWPFLLTYKSKCFNVEALCLVFSIVDLFRGGGEDHVEGREP